MQVIFKKELLSAARDRRLIILSVLILLLVGTGLFSGYNRFSELKAEKEVLNEANRKDWENQEPKHAHSASHYGTYLYTPQPLLSFVDFGVQHFTGSSIRIEAHLQQGAMFANAMESGDGIRFGTMSIALVLQVFVPLLLIFMCFNAVSAEKENGTLKLLMVQGGDKNKVLWQKVAAYTLVVLILLVIVLLLSVLFPIANGLTLGKEALFRIAMLFLVYGIFYFIVVSLTIAVSALSRTSRNSLMVMLGLWVLFIVLLPKYAANLGDNLYPLPSKKQLETAISADVKNGLDGHKPGDERSKQFTDSILNLYHVETISELPINIDGLLMQADEDYRAKVTGKYYGELYAQIGKSNKVSHFVSFINPFIAVRDLSMGIAQTDYYNQVIFEQQVRDYRLYMMRYLNEYMSNHTKQGDWDTKLTKQGFTNLKKFDYKPLTILQSLKNYKLLFISLFMWATMAIMFIGLVSKKLKIIQ